MATKTREQWWKDNFHSLGYLFRKAEEMNCSRDELERLAALADACGQFRVTGAREEFTIKRGAAEFAAVTGWPTFHSGGRECFHVTYSKAGIVSRLLLHHLHSERKKDRAWALALHWNAKGTPKGLVAWWGSEGRRWLDEPTLSIVEAMDVIGCSRETIYRLVARGHLIKSCSDYSRARFPESLVRLVAANRNPDGKVANPMRDAFLSSLRERANGRGEDAFYAALRDRMKEKR